MLNITLVGHWFQIQPKIVLLISIGSEPIFIHMFPYFSESYFRYIQESSNSEKTDL